MPGLQEAEEDQVQRLRAKPQHVAVLIRDTSDDVRVRCPANDLVGHLKVARELEDVAAVKILQRHHVSVIIHAEFNEEAQQDPQTCVRSPLPLDCAPRRSGRSSPGAYGAWVHCGEALANHRIFCTADDLEVRVIADGTHVHPDDSVPQDSRGDVGEDKIVGAGFRQQAGKISIVFVWMPTSSAICTA